MGTTVAVASSLTLAGTSTTLAAELLAEFVMKTLLAVKPMLLLSLLTRRTHAV